MRVASLFENVARSSYLQSVLARVGECSVFFHSFGEVSHHSSIECVFWSVWRGQSNNVLCNIKNAFQKLASAVKEMGASCRRMVGVHFFI